MSLERFSNINEIRGTAGLSRGFVWNRDDIETFELETIAVKPSKRPVVEIHIYTPTNELYLGGGPTEDFIVSNDKIYIDYATALGRYNIKRGYFKIVVNIHKDVIGTYEEPILQIKEIASNRRELLLVTKPTPDGDDTYATILTDYINEYGRAFDRDIAINFGNNNIVKIIGQKEWIYKNDIVVRLYSLLPENVPLNTRISIIEQYSDSYIDNISLDLIPPIEKPSILRGPNFDISTGYTMNTETDFYNWNQLLDSNLSTSQKIIDSYFSGSLSGIELGIDYTAFDNFVYYSSARERLANFKYKLELIEYYDDRLGILNSTSGSSSGSLSVNKNTITERKDQLIGTFDGFEKWLYYEPTASIYTHGASGSFLTLGVEGEGYALRPFPKFLSYGQYKLYHTTASISVDWYNGFDITASIYDEQNPYSLVTTIPQSIREDANNSEYELFVNMIGHHFDILWTYINSLTRIQRLEEHPKRGVDKDVLVDVAKSMGWQLTNGKQASQLWQYKLGTNQSGEYASTGSIFSQSDEAITSEVWRRIVNNLPYILKSRGTERSIKALMNVYGIPQTLLSIREYGGPKVGNEWPVLIEDRYCYALKIDSGSNINYSTIFVSSSIGDWGRPLGKNNVVPPITREWRFKPYTGSNMILYSQISSSGDSLTHIALQHTGSYSGSMQYGRVVLVFGNAMGSMPMTASTDWLPLYNGEFWNIQYWQEASLPHLNTGSNTDTVYSIKIQHSSDYIKGKVSHSSSLSITPTNGNHYLTWAEPKVIDRNVVYLAGATSSQDILNVDSYLTNFLGTLPSTFSGSLQEYREWLEVIRLDAFNDHTLNPTSYVSSLTATSSYDTLLRHYTLGTETIGYDLSVDGTIISSSHPNQSVLDFSTKLPYSTNATAIGFTVQQDLQRGNFIPIEETYYIAGASLGTSNPRSEKIRLDDNMLVRNLSPINTAERSRFDNSPNDSNKLGLFYSFADQVNKDIYNHTGRIELDDYIGDPDDEYEYSYDDLKFFSREYWKKFTNSSDANSYIRIFSQYDFALFNQIRQLLPERVDEVTGILVEPNVLERSKVIISKPIKVENPQYDMNVPSVPPTASGDANLQFDAVFETEIYQLSGSFYEEYIANPQIFVSSASVDYCTIETLPVDELNSYTASIIDSNYFVSRSIGSDRGFIKNNYNNQNILFQPSSNESTVFLYDSTAPLDQYTWQRRIQLPKNAGVPAHITTFNGGTVPTGSYLDQIRFKLDTFNSYDVRLKPSAIFAFAATIVGAPSAINTSLEYTATIVETETEDVDSRISHVYDIQTGTFVSDGSGKKITFKSILVPAYTYLTVILQIKVPDVIIEPIETIVSASITFQPNKGIRYDGAQNGIYNGKYTASVANHDIVTNASLGLDYFFDTLDYQVYMYNADYTLFNEDGVPGEFVSSALIASSSYSGSNTWIYLGGLAHGDPGVPESFNSIADTAFEGPFTVEITDQPDGGAFTFVSSSVLSVSLIDSLTLRRFQAYITIEEICHSVEQQYIDNCRLDDVYQQNIYHYSGSKTLKTYALQNAQHAVSQSRGLFYSRSLAPACYRELSEMEDRLYYSGCQLIGPDFNVPSDNPSLNGKAVIEVFEVNPNQIFFNNAPAQVGPGSTLDQGNLTIR
jgi:hypothetical protein